MSSALFIKILLKLKTYVARDKMLVLVGNSKSITIITLKEDLVSSFIMVDAKGMVIGLQTKESVKLFVLFMKSQSRPTTKVGRCYIITEMNLQLNNLKFSFLCEQKFVFCLLSLVNVRRRLSVTEDGTMMILGELVSHSFIPVVLGTKITLDPSMNVITYVNPNVR